jgi:hypothetical protein
MQVWHRTQKFRDPRAKGSFGYGGGRASSEAIKATQTGS